MIPKTIHFIFGLSEDFAKMPFSLYHYLAALSAKVTNKDYEIVIHYYYEPVNNEWWERCKQIAKMDKLRSSPTSIYGKIIKHCAHKADFVRVEILLVEGGVYLDMDTICIKSFDPVLIFPEKFVMGLEIWNGQIIGLCNAVIISEKNASFLQSWRDRFIDFNPDDWNKISVQTPFKLAVKYPHLIHIEPPESFFRLNWGMEDIQTMHEGILNFERSYSQHLWECKSYELYLSKLTLEDIKTRNSSYNLIARKMLDEYETHIKLLF